jgi:hypothetical protein
MMALFEAPSRSLPAPSATTSEQPAVATSATAPKKTQGYERRDALHMSGLQSFLRLAKTRVDLDHRQGGQHDVQIPFDVIGQTHVCLPL